MNQDKFIIVCAAACLKRLQLLDVIPDIILTIDGQKDLVLPQFDVQEKYYKDSLIISSIAMSHSGCIAISLYRLIKSDSLFTLPSISR